MVATSQPLMVVYRGGTISASSSTASAAIQSFAAAMGIEAEQLRYELERLAINIRIDVDRAKQTLAKVEMVLTKAARKMKERWVLFPGVDPATSRAYRQQKQVEAAFQEDRLSRRQAYPARPSFSPVEYRRSFVPIAYQRRFRRHYRRERQRA